MAPGAGDDYHPSWSPDGLRVVFTSTRDGNPELYVVDVDGKHLERLTNDPADDDYPSFSSDGAQIVWESKRDGRWQIFAMDQDRVRPLVEPAGQSNDRFPRISPDGLQIVFASDRDRPGGLEIYVQELADGRPHRLTTFETGSASGPQWSPDGQQIVFFSDARGTNDIYTLSVSDGAFRLFSDSPDDERWPIWGP